MIPKGTKDKGALGGGDFLSVSVVQAREEGGVQGSLQCGVLILILLPGQS